MSGESQYPRKPNMLFEEARKYIKGSYDDQQSIHDAAAVVAVELGRRFSDRCLPIKAGDATSRDLREAAFSIFEALKNHQMPVTDVQMYMLEMAMGVRKFGSTPRNERKDNFKFIEVMLRDAEWIAACGEPMSENKLAKEAEMPRRTIGRWRESPEWQSKLPTLIKCEKMILEIRRR